MIKIPKYKVRVSINKKPYYAIYSTIVDDFITPFFSSIEKLHEWVDKHFSIEDAMRYKKMKPVSYKKIFGKTAKARLNKGNIEIVFKAHVIKR